MRWRRATVKEALARPAPEKLGERDLAELVRRQPVPAHIAIIMDGNGRWATQRGFPRIAGHHEGVKTARTVVKAADALGVRYLTIFAISN
jgi:undecaprenyl diphosphate synthase